MSTPREPMKAMPRTGAPPPLAAGPRARRSANVAAAAALVLLPWLLPAGAAALAQTHPAVTAIDAGEAFQGPGDGNEPPEAAGVPEAVEPAAPPADAETVRVYFEPSVEPAARTQAAEQPGTVVRRGYLGVELIELTPELRVHFGSPGDAGVMVARVVSGSPADRAGLKVGDIITALDGVPVASSADARAGVRPLDEGALLEVEVRRDGQLQVMTANVELRERREIDHAPPPTAACGGAAADRTLPAGPATGAAAAEGVSRAAKPRLQPLKTPREELLEKKLKALEKRLNELESRIPKG